MKKMSPVVHFEMPAEDMARMKKFYESAFGWKMNQLGPDMGDYVVVNTTETDKDGMVKAPGNINGGFYKKIEDPLSHCPSIVVAVDNIEEAMKSVKASGGQVIGGHKKDGTPDMIPGVGLYASIIDTEGNRISILQPNNER
jgi:predicted enzyme related to lactoylglutathione lyase